MTFMALSDRLAPLSDDDTLTPGAATRLVRDVLGSQSPEAGERVYRALRAWTWKALTTRRYDAEVRAWRELVRASAAAVRSTREEAVAVKLSVLSDLLYESIAFAEHEPVSSILQRAHVRQILLRLSAHHPASRERLASALGLKDANLSRVLLLLTSAGLIEREQVGRAATFRLTRRGEDARRSIQRDQKVRSKRRAERVMDGGAPAPSDNARERDDVLRARGRGRGHWRGVAGAIDHAPDGALINLTRFESRKRAAAPTLVVTQRVEPPREDFEPAVQLVTPTSHTRILEAEHA